MVLTTEEWIDDEEEVRGGEIVAQLRQVDVLMTQRRTLRLAEDAGYPICVDKPGPSVILNIEGDSRDPVRRAGKS